jgi:hypothetical protein
MVNRKFSVDLRYGIEEEAHLQIAGQTVTSMTWSPDGQQLVAGCEDGSLLLWEELPQVDPPRRRPLGKSMITDLDWTKDGRLIAACTEGGSVIVCNSQTLLPPINGTKAISKEALLRIAWNPKGDGLVTGGLDNRLYLADPMRRSGQWNVQTAIGHYSPIRSIVWSQDGKTILSGTQDGVVGVWADSRVDNQLRNFLSCSTPWSHDGPVVDLAWSVQGQQVVSASHDGFLRFWGLSGFDPLGSYDCGERIFAVGLSADGETAVARTARSLIFIDSKHLKEILRIRSWAGLDNGQMTLNRSLSRIAVDGNEGSSINVYKVNFNYILANSRASRQRYKCAQVFMTGVGVEVREIAKALSNRTAHGTPNSSDFERYIFHREEVQDADHSASEIREICLCISTYQDCEILQPLREVNPVAFLHIFNWETATLASAKSRRPFTNESVFVAATHPEHPNARDPILSSALRQEFQVRDIYPLDDLAENDRKLRETISSSITWENLPTLPQAHILDHVCTFLSDQRRSKSRGGPLSLEYAPGKVIESEQTLHDLFIGYNRIFDSPDSFKLFELSLEMLHKSGIVHRFGVGQTVLLEPRYLHEYAAAITRMAKGDKEGLGRVLIEDSRARDHRPGDALQLPFEVRIADRHQEMVFFQSFLLDLERKSLAYQVATNVGKYIVIPTECTRVMRNRDVEKPVTSFRFDANGRGVLSSLIVRLLALPLFCLEESNVFTNGAIFTTDHNERCVIYLRTDSPGGESEISTFFEGDVSAKTRELFLTFVSHLIKSCVSRYTSDEPATYAVKGQETAVLNREVIIVCEAGDLSNVKQIAAALKKRNIETFFEDEVVPPGAHDGERVAIMNRHKVAIVALGSHEASVSQRNNYMLLQQSTCRIIPIILPSAPSEFKLPDALVGCKPVDFHQLGEEPYDRLAMGILAAEHPAELPSAERLKLNGSPESIGKVIDLVKQSRKQIFVSYSHKDAAWLKHLLAHLGPLQREGRLSLWHDKQIRAGDIWRREIDAALKSAVAALLLVSVDFLNSDFIVNNELPQLLCAAENDGLKIFSLILTPCLFYETSNLSRFQALNSPDKPLSALRKSARDRVLYEAAKQIDTLMAGQSGDQYRVTSSG